MPPEISGEKAQLFGLLSLPGAGNRAVGELLTLFGSPAAAWKAVRKGKAGRGLKQGHNYRWKEFACMFDPVVAYDTMEKKGMRACARGEPEYPALLDEIHDPPWMIFYRGSLPSAEPVVAIVGSRKATSYGREVARWLAGEIARKGINVASGAAYGVDSFAHRGALDTGGFTTAVLGCGVDVVYPRRNAPLYREIEATGCLLSEYRPGTPPARYHFPARNRIIAGISRVVVVVEASETSGALITAEFALSEGREVLAVPGGVFSKNSGGTNDLIKSGASPVTCPEDILREIGLAPGEVTCTTSDQPPLPITGVTHGERELLDVLQGGSSRIEELLEETGFTAGEMLSILARLEIKGLVVKGPGGQYQAAAP